MKKRKKTNAFSIVLTSIILVCSLLMFLSIPVLFDYESLENKLENKFYAEFKFDLKILDSISYKAFPKPHLLVKKANLILNNKRPDSATIEVNDLKVFIPYRNIYSMENLEFDGIEINNANFEFKLEDIKDFRNHLFYKINEQIKIKNSKFFYLDKKNNTILISPIHNLNYKIDKNNKVKEFKIIGNIFDIDFTSLWKRNYDTPKNTFHEIKFKNPNLFIKNLFELENNSYFSGKSYINFLNENIVIDYIYNKDKIVINPSEEIKNQKINLNANIDVNPFNFDSEITIIGKKLKFLINGLLLYIIDLNKDYLGNLNGKLTLNLLDLDNEVISNGKITFLIKEKSVKLINSVFEINNIGIIKSDFKYYENEGDLIFSTKNVFEIKDKIEFARKFQLTSKLTKKVNKIFFNLEKNIDNGKILISNIYINEIEDTKHSDNFYIVKSFQTLKSTVRKVLD